MRKLCIGSIACIAMLILANVAVATPLNSGSWGDDVVVDANALTIEINPNQSWYQNADYHGGWFQFESISEVTFAEDLWTWDSTPYDVFFSGIVQADVLPDMETLKVSANNTFAGMSWQDNMLEFASIEATFGINPAEPVFVYAFWDTQSQMYSDNGWGSGGKVKVSTTSAPVPEPATMLLFGTGLAGLAGFTGRKRKKEQKKEGNFCIQSMQKSF